MKAKPKQSTSAGYRCWSVTLGNCMEFKPNSSKKSFLTSCLLERLEENKSSPDLGGGCAGQREGAGRGTLPNVAIDNPAGLVTKMSKM